MLIGRSNYLVEREVFGVVRPRERAQAADDELGGVGEAVEDDDAEARGEKLQHGVARTRSETGQPAAGERSQTLAAIATWGTAVDGAGPAVGVRETVEEAVEGSRRRWRRRCRCGGAGGEIG